MLETALRYQYGSGAGVAVLHVAALCRSGQPELTFDYHSFSQTRSCHRWLSQWPNVGASNDHTVASISFHRWPSPMAVWRCTASTTEGWATGGSATACASSTQEVSCFERACIRTVSTTERRLWRCHLRLLYPGDELRMDGMEWTCLKGGLQCACKDGRPGGRCACDAMHAGGCAWACPITMHPAGPAFRSHASAPPLPAVPTGLQA